MKPYFHHIIKYVLLTMILIMQQSMHAQSQSLDFLRSTGKIYSVVLVILIIFIGIIIFLYRLDNKLTKLENHIKNGH